MAYSAFTKRSEKSGTRRVFLPSRKPVSMSSRSPSFTGWQGCAVAYPSGPMKGAPLMHAMNSSTTSSIYTSGITFRGRPSPAAASYGVAPWRHGVVVRAAPLAEGVRQAVIVRPVRFPTRGPASARRLLTPWACRRVVDDDEKSRRPPVRFKFVRCPRSACGCRGRLGLDGSVHPRVDDPPRSRSCRSPAERRPRPRPVRVRSGGGRSCSSLELARRLLAAHSAP